MATINFSVQAIAENNQALRELDLLIVKLQDRTLQVKNWGYSVMNAGILEFNKS